MGDGSDDLTVTYRIRGEHDPAGAQDATKFLDDLGEKARQAKVPIDEFSSSQNVSAREVRLATAEILRMTGVTQEAGLIGRLAGVGFRAMGDAAEYANLAIVGATLGLSVIIPALFEWIGASRNAAADSKAFNDELLGMRSEVDRYVEKVPGASRVTREWAEALNQLALAQQVLKELELEKKLDEMKKAAEGSVFNLQENWRAIKALVLGGKDLEDETRRVTAETNASNAAIAAATKEIEALKLAIANHKPLTDFFQAGETAAEKESKRVAELNRLDAENRKTLQKQEIGDYDAFIKDQEDMDKEFQKSLEHDKEERKKDVEEETRFELEADREKLQEKLQYTQLATEAIGTLFGKGKAAAAAEALIRAYEAYELQLSEGDPYTAVFRANVALGLGLAQAAKIGGVGFDDPRNDAIALGFGEKWTYDLMAKLDAGFYRALSAATPATQGPSTIHQSTHVDRSTHYGGVSLGGIFGEDPHRMMIKVNRELFRPRRFEQRTSLGSQ